jgi:PAS domain S-box-containing protein
MALQNIHPDSNAETPLDYERLFNAAPDAYLIVLPDDPRYTIVAASDAYLRATLSERESIVGRSLFEVFPDNPEDPNSDGVRNLTASLRRVIGTRTADAMKAQRHDIRRPGGAGFEERFWAARNSPVFDRRGELVQIIHCVEDVSDKVRENKLLMQLAIDHAAIGTWLFDPATGTFTSSEEVRRMFGDASPFPGNDMPFDLIHPDDRPLVEAKFWTALRDRETYDAEFRVLREDGVRWIRSKGRLIDTSVGPARLLGFAEDITERKKAEEALARSQKELESQWAELETLYRTAPIGLALFDPVEFRYLRLNDRQAEIVGLPPEQILGKTLTEIAPIQGLREMFEGVAKGVPLRNALLEGELPMRPGEHRYWTVNYEPVFAADGTVQAITAASLEITVQKRAEQALIESEKLAVVGRLAASIAHEINNPLESITNLLYLARHNQDLASVKQFLGMAESELARVSQIATQTLRFHRQSSRPTPTRMYDLLDNTLALYQGRISNAGIKLEKQYLPTPPVTCFADEMRQVFVNLISNAVDATAPGGRIIVRKRERKDWRAGTQGVRITLADTGIGMGPATRKRIFEAFFTTKGNTGTGLGLWVSHGIIEKHGGKITVRSRQGPKHHGTVFSVFIPYDNPTVEKS